MRILLVTAPAAGSGKTGVLAALALRLGYAGRRVLALRLGSSDDPAAAADAEFYASLPFARGRGGAPLAVEAAVQLAEASERPVELLLLEDAGDGSAAPLAGRADTRILVVVRGDPRSQTEALAVLAEQAGAQIGGVLATAVPERVVAALGDGAAELPLGPLIVIPEDRALYAPGAGDLLEALDAEVILGDPDPDQLVEHIEIGPLTVDPADPYFKRRPNKAVLTRSDKTDIQLAALHNRTELLILTGGLPPSPYAIDRAAGEEVPIFLTRYTTPEAVGRLHGVFGGGRFRGEPRLERMAELLAPRLDDAAVLRLAGLD